MTELGNNPQAIRQGAVAAACVAAVSVALPAMSHRGAEQRSDAEWAARAAAFQMALAKDLQAQGATARVELASFSATDLGYRLQAAGPITADLKNDQALFVQAALRDKASLAGLAPFEPARLRGADQQAREQHCLAQAIYFEARGEAHVGQMAVAEVVVNRVKSRHYPDTFCGVVYQGSYRSTGCQFTFSCDGSLKRKPRGEAWRRANVVAEQVIAGLVPPKTHGATHYHTTEVDPVWSASLVETTRIGAHIFYRFPNKRERAMIRARVVEPQLAVLQPDEALGAVEDALVVEAVTRVEPSADAQSSAVVEPATVDVTPETTVQATVEPVAAI